MNILQTEYEFILPKGYVDNNENVHKRGKMRLATAGDELSATRDPRVMKNPSYLPVLMLSKVIELEGVEAITLEIIEQLFISDMHFLQNMYEKINSMESPAASVVCPECGHMLEIPLSFTCGE